LCYVGFVDQIGIITPGWAGQTPAGVQKNPENIPKVGAICVNLPTPNFDYLTWDGPVLAPTISSRRSRHTNTKQILPDLPPYDFKHKRLFSNVETMVMTGDWHPGSVWALCPPRLQLATGGVYCFNKVQEQLYNRYLECVDEFRRPDVLLLNGDLLDGSGSIDSGRDIAFTSAFDQMRIAEHMIKLWDAKHVLITYGSRYHVERDAVTMERILAERVHATEYGFILKPTLNGIRCSFAHEVPVGTNWAYRPTAAATQLVVNRLQNAGTSVQLLVRSHVHQSCYVCISEQTSIVAL